MLLVIPYIEHLKFLHRCIDQLKTSTVLQGKSNIDGWKSHHFYMHFNVYFPILEKDRISNQLR